MAFSFKPTFGATTTTTTATGNDYANSVWHPYKVGEGLTKYRPHDRTTTAQYWRLRSQTARV